MIATIVKHQWFSGSPLPLNEWFGRNHWYQWFFNGFWSINHWPRWFFSLATIGLDGFAMVFGLATIGLNGFSMVANHWSNDGMVTIHRYGLEGSVCKKTRIFSEQNSWFLLATLCFWSLGFTFLFRIFELELLIDENHRAKINIISDIEKLLKWLPVV